MVVSDTPLEIPELIRPINDDTATGLTPTFEWTNIGNAVKYKIVVRTSSQTGDIWEAEVEATSESTINIAYPNNGLPLNANTRYFWFVAGYSQDIEEVNVYSEIETFRTP
jgi:hypothetical protein